MLIVNKEIHKNKLPPDLEKFLMKYVYILNIRSHHGQVYFPEVIWAIMFNVCGHSSVRINKSKAGKEILH
jgi:hypothetical protein